MIPRPVQVTDQPGHFVLTPALHACWKNHGLGAIATLRQVQDPELGREGYELLVSPQAVQVSAQTPAGYFYAEQTLTQLVDRNDQIACVNIRDWPRFAWRGMHLDVVRHFFPVAFVKRYLDLMALHKLNAFHWHLTDDQGWRIEVKRYPRLTEVGAWRVNREHQPWNERDPQREGEIPEYGGYYTQEQISDIVAYARDRYIDVVPEIEMPAHALAALAAYPDLSCTGGPFAVAPGQYWPETDLYCAGNDATFVFLENVLTEVAELFPGPFIHIGGDEADTREWANCAKCQRRMVEEGIKNVAGLQGYFTARVGTVLRKLKKRLVGWDEILGGDLPTDAVVMSWRGIEKGLTAAKQGHDVVMTPASHLYFDHYQNDPATEPKAFGGFSPLSKVYSFEPAPEDVSAEETHHILGAQANLWTEFVPNSACAEYMVLPRMAAVAELVWSPRSSRDWPSFKARLAGLTELYDQRGFHYSGDYC